MQDSRLISFMSEDECYAVHLLDGQKVISELAVIHDLNGPGFLFYRDCVLSSLPFVALLKHGETMGFYIDNEDPYFAFKVEMSEHGHMRTLMLPGDFNTFPDSISGKARIVKMAKGKNPYNSIIELKNQTPQSAANLIIKESYQMEGVIILSEDSDQSALIMKLPRKSWDKDEVLPAGLPLEEFTNNFESLLPSLLNEGQNDEEMIISLMKNHNFIHLKGKDIAFKCSCSRERMIVGVSSLLSTHSLDEIFEEKDTIETKCDYCKTHYEIKRDEVATMKQ